MEEHILRLLVHYHGTWELDILTGHEIYVGGKMTSMTVDEDLLCHIDLCNEIAETVNWDPSETISMCWMRKNTSNEPLYGPLNSDKDIINMINENKNENEIHIYVSFEKIEMPPQPCEPTHAQKRVAAENEPQQSRANTENECQTRADAEYESQPHQCGSTRKKCVDKSKISRTGRYDGIQWEDEGEKECHMTDSEAEDDDDSMDIDYEVGSESSRESEGSSTDEDIEEVKDEANNAGMANMLASGTEFDNVDAFRDALRNYSIKNHFGCRFLNNDKRRVTAKCLQPNCTWRLHASVLQDKMTFKIKSHVGEHSCKAINMIGNNMATKNWVANKIHDWIKIDPKLTVKTIIARLKEQYGVVLNYHKVHRAKQIVFERLYGNSESSFLKIPSLQRELISRNDGSMVRFVHGERDSFGAFFVCFKACIEGFKMGCRPLLGLDGCHLKSKYEGMLIAATALDGNYGLFPLAYAIVDSETGYNWKWFLECLRDAIGLIPNLTFMSDRAKGLHESVGVIFPHAEHRYCMRHFYKNFKRKHPGKSLEKVMWQASRAYVKEVYAMKLEDLKKQSEAAWAWVISQQTDAWSRCSFGVGAKCHYITNNLSESFNNFVGDGRYRSYVDLIDNIRQKLMVKLDERRRHSLKWEGTLTPKVSRYVQWVSREAVKAGIVYRSGDSEAEVDDGEVRCTVDLETRICSCRMWQVSGLPCKHAAATILNLRRKIESYVDDYFSVEKYKLTYAGKISTLPDKSFWTPVDVLVLPPYTKKKRGRPKKNRIIGHDEDGSQKHYKTCKRCGGRGHNIRRCNETVNPLPATAFEARSGSSNSASASASVSSSSLLSRSRSRGRGTLGLGRGMSQGRATWIPSGRAVGRASARANIDEVQVGGRGGRATSGQKSRGRGWKNVDPFVRSTQ